MYTFICDHNKSCIYVCTGVYTYTNIFKENVKNIYICIYTSYICRKIDILID